jgi:hypothetical protein
MCSTKSSDREFLEKNTEAEATLRDSKNQLRGLKKKQHLNQFP